MQSPLLPLVRGANEDRIRKIALESGSLHGRLRFLVFPFSGTAIFTLSWSCMAPRYHESVALEDFAIWEREERLTMAQVIHKLFQEDTQYLTQACPRVIVVVTRAHAQPDIPQTSQRRLEGGHSGSMFHAVCCLETCAAAELRGHVAPAEAPKMPGKAGCSG